MAVLSLMAADPKLIEELTKAIMAQMNAPMPQQPQPPPMQGLQPTQAFAAARNPQMLPYFSQMANQPAQSQYQAASAAFQGAMGNRQKAMGYGVDLAQAQMRAESASQGFRLIPRNVVRNGVNVGIVEIYQNGVKVGETESGELAYAPTIDQGIDPSTGKPTIMRFPKNAGGTAFPVQDASGRNIRVPPPAAAINDNIKRQAYIQSEQVLRKAWSDLKTATKGQNVGEQMLGQTVGEMKFGAVAAPNYAAFESTVKATLNAYIRSVTGLSFPEQAYVRHRSELPVATDSDALADQKIKNVLRSALAEMGIYEETYGDAPSEYDLSPDEKILIDRLRQKQGGPR